MIDMALRRVSSSTEAEIRAILGRSRVAMMEVGGHRVLLQVIEDDFDLDAILEANPEAVRQLEAGIRALEAGDVVHHDDVVRACREKRN